MVPVFAIQLLTDCFQILFACRRIQRLEEQLDQAARVKDKYRKKYERLKKRQRSIDSPAELAVEGGCPEIPANCDDTSRTKTKKLLEVVGV